MSPTRDLVMSASQRYRACGRFAYHFARGKLRQDPVFAAILARGLLAGRSRILDLGCGRGEFLEAAVAGDVDTMFTQMGHAF